ncbi:hypothetical protein F2Q68_00038398 [Brassica cretica]|uniref:Agenet domain-containing protein n=2 Tax=Brassica cretica TaxID=69181 RepID=A0ABQ7AHU0_BRACR|nr:hypothetical protein F2Q68_00038398 [Brassica cretica]KAF3497339.1 hypothetical protein DY000_02051994 [Brassica cretica]
MVYLEAKVLSKLPHGYFYNVEYKNLVTEGEDPQPLVETISADEIRPMPPKLSQPSMFSLHDKVDAFDLDAWWFGGITGQEGDTYSVYFPTTNDVCKYPLQRLRRHLEFVNVIVLFSLYIGFQKMVALSSRRPNKIDFVTNNGPLLEIKCPLLSQPSGISLDAILKS